MAAFNERRAKMLAARYNKEPNMLAVATPCVGYWRVDFEVRYRDGHHMSGSEGSLWPALAWAWIQAARHAR